MNAGYNMKRPIKRKDFLRQGTVITAGLLTWRSPLLPDRQLGKPLNIPDGQSPDEKPPGHLYERGVVTTYLKTKNELQYIGMPVGGINCGTLYLGGDGRLWLWDIFNTNQEGIEPKEVLMKPPLAEWRKNDKVRSRDGACYIEPSKDIRPLEQGFAIKIKYHGTTVVKRFHKDDWDEIKFEATYPLAVIHYMSNDLPLEIKLTAFSPFIPLDEDNSNIPVTIQSFEIKNTGTKPAEIEITAWLENAVNKFSAKKPADGKRINTIVRQTNHLSVYSTFKPAEPTGFQQEGDTGSMCLSLIGAHGTAAASFTFPYSPALSQTKEDDTAFVNADQPLIGGIIASDQIASGKTISKEFAISWHFPNVGKRINVPDAKTGHYYVNKFADALSVSGYVAENFSFLSVQTKLWKQTWYDSSLPWWFMERSFVNIAALATTTSHRFKTGRSWAWEGVGACEGNCTHVWHYAQAIGRIFPAIERDNRQRVDLGIALQENGGIWFRGEYDKRPAIDGQAGRVLGCLREHQMSADSSFLKNNWSAIKRAVQFIINQDSNGDGLIDTPLENTLDAVWDGEIAWIAGLCIAAVKAGGLMAEEMKDDSFALQCAAFVAKGINNMDNELFNGEYFIHKPDAAKGRKGIGSYNTCHIDQVLGQSWAWQTGLGRLNDKEKTISALKALWKYNFMTDVGPYLKEHAGWRPYALPGEAGMVMNTNPKNEANPYGESVTWQAGYFSECMTGFEHQVASHLMAEGMTEEALTLTRAIHDRYHAVKRNPFNEIECSDHYGRAMASYGTFITACGFEYNGPKGYIRFAPAWNKENFRSPFTSAKGWGTYQQHIKNGNQSHEIKVRYGTLDLTSISVEKQTTQAVRDMSVMLGSEKIPADFQQVFSKIIIRLKQPVTVGTGNALKIVIT